MHGTAGVADGEKPQTGLGPLMRKVVISLHLSLVETKRREANPLPRYLPNQGPGSLQYCALTGLS